MNLLLWGAETWSLCKLQLDQLEVFLHRSIHRILQISISNVQEDRIRNKRVQEMFYSIPCVRNMIAAHQADFIGKMIQGPPNRPLHNMITACCNHKWQVGRPQMTGKTSWSKISAFCSRMSTQYTSISLVCYEIGSMKPPIKILESTG